MKNSEKTVINPGDLYWVKLPGPDGADPGYAHPQVVIQAQAGEPGGSGQVIVCALTSNLKRASWPGNVLLAAGEGNLSRASVVVVSQVSTLEKAQLGEYLGSLSAERVSQILAGRRFLQAMTPPCPIQAD